MDLFSIKNVENEKRVVLNIHGFIGMWDVTAQELMNQINAIENVDVIEAHINSYGGEVFEGVAIYNWLKAHGARVETVVDSVAASIASLIFLAGEKRTVYDTSMVMVHMPTGVSIGDANQMRKDAETLDKIDEATLRRAYRSAVGDKLSDDEIDELMKNETWLDSDEAIEYGFATDRVEDSNEEPVEARFKNAAEGVEDFGVFQFKSLPETICAAVGYKPKMTREVPINTAPAKEQKPLTGESEMENREQPQAQVDTEAIRNEAAKAERKRIELIRASADAMGVSGDVVENLISGGKTVDEALPELTAAKKVKDSLPEAPQAVEPRIEMGVDEHEKFQDMAKVSMAQAAGIKVDPKAAADVAKEDAPRSLHSLMRACLIKNGESVGKVMNMNATDLARKSLRVARNAISTGTGDLTNILADTLNRVLGEGYANAQTTWASWVKVIPVRDFKAFDLPKVSVFGDMDVIPEGKPFNLGSLSDKKETETVKVRGRSMNVSMQALVNDDLGALARIPSMMGAAYNFSQNKVIYDYLYGSTGVGPTMNEDSVALFNSAHTNYETGAGAPSTTTLSVGRKKMRNQTAPKGEGKDTAQPLNLFPSYIIHGTSLETTTEQLLGSQYDTAGTNSITLQPFAQGGRTPLQIVVDAYLETLTTTGWYLAANQSQIETIVLLALDGQVAPTIRSEDSRVGEALGINYDVYGAYAPLAGDYRGLYFHKGA